MPRRVAGANVEAGVQTRLRSWPQPPRREHPACAKTYIPPGKQWRPRGRRRKDGLSETEIAVRCCLYWPDGTRKMSSKDNLKPRNISLLLQALLDKYNEDHHLLGLLIQSMPPFQDLAYELDGVVCFQEFYMGEIGCLSMYYHLNFTTKTKGADDFHGGINNLFFAEVTQIKGESAEYVLNCFCMVKRNDNGRCYECMYYGNVDLKHPVNADKYKGRHSHPHKVGYGLVDRGVPEYIQNEEDMLADEEARIRYIYKCPDDRTIVAKSNGARMPAVLAKREDVGLAKRENAGLAKRDDAQGKGKYIVPARRQLV
ncbi:hypothetical protein CFC21_062885 [Triticum aestivum]|uniref:DUF3615 domain-containing protein n=2 Tax=Triticum aestivum TaxID=4565 RepID=A0A3B6JP76_WHEAT|nr:hypothetical protein CFC21_062885 [Triticum aestivum]